MDIKTASISVMRKQLGIMDAIKESERCLLCKDAPCSKNCPAGTDPGKFIRQIRFENFKGAARTIRNNNILGTICAYTCPVEKLCAKDCCAQGLDRPIDISGLQRFACDYGKTHSLEAFEKVSGNLGKVAVIGAGPAGLSCAAELAKSGVSVVIFEQAAEAGGVASWGIPRFRLPDDAITNDLKNLTDLGVTIKYNSIIASPNEAAHLLKQGYDAVFISIGLTEPYKLPILDGYSNVIDYINFLRQAKTAAKLNLNNKNVIVIGGGSVAVDTACTAVNLGAKKVTMLALEGLAELPADEEEKAIARQMHVIVKPNSKLVAAVVEKDHVTFIKGTEIEWVVPGNFHPDNAKPIAGTEFSMQADYIVQAIGTRPSSEIAKIASTLQTKGKGTIVVNNDFATNIPGIFAGGDVVNGGATIVQALGEGKKAAQSICSFIRGK
jgi:dihydropyrimidine dehydrogenase (NAD+) subunit PreT